MLVVPDVICNAGGVTVSYFEWVQGLSSFFWTEDEINMKLDKIMVGALKRIWGHRRQAQDHAAHGHLRGGLRAHPDRAQARGSTPSVNLWRRAAPGLVQRAQRDLAYLGLALLDVRLPAAAGPGRPLQHARRILACSA